MTGFRQTKDNRPFVLSVSQGCPRGQVNPCSTRGKTLDYLLAFENAPNVIDLLLCDKVILRHGDDDDDDDDCFLACRWKSGDSMAATQSNTKVLVSTKDSSLIVCRDSKALKHQRHEPFLDLNCFNNSTMDGQQP